MNHIVKLSILVSVLTLSACATLSEEQCLDGDWYNIGHTDGSFGHSAQMINYHKKSCEKYSIKPNLEEYELGYKKGLRRYCVPAKAFSLGRDGHNFPEACGLVSGDIFVEAYHHGRSAYDIKKEIQRVKEIRSEIYHANEQMSLDIDHAEAQLVDDGTPVELRRKLLRKIRKLEHAIDDNHYEIAALSREIKDLTVQYDSIHF